MSRIELEFPSMIFSVYYNIYMPREDTSQLVQDLANIHRNLDETIADYRTRVKDMLHEITSKVMEKNGKWIREVQRIQ